jgi:hypothetical protein
MTRHLRGLMNRALTSAPRDGPSGQWRKALLQKNNSGRLTNHTGLSHIATPFTVRCLDVLIRYA